MRWLLALSVAVVALGAVGLVRLASGSRQVQHPPPSRFTAAETWSAGTHPAPAFALHDERGASLTLASLKGRPVVLTFLDPVCRNLCPLEARVVAAASQQLPASERPQIIAVSVNPWADSAKNFALDKVHWQLGNNWRWAVGTYRELAPVWRRYQIAVLVQKRVIQGITVRSISHTEASFVLGPSGDERAVYLYPFKATDFAKTLRDAAKG
jgi:cytochrome oxidase Cu insertion factor (SCO1/SenC/PrrC family)